MKQRTHNPLVTGSGPVRTRCGAGAGASAGANTVLNMELASMIVNLGIFVATVIAAVIALRLVNDARQARDDASAHERTALDAAARSASAAEVAVRHHERTADTLEKQTALLESAATHREEWALEALTDASIDQRWKATNKTGDDVTHVSIGTPDGFNEQWIKPDTEETDDVPRGGSIFFTFIRRLSSPTSRTIWVNWTPADGSAQKKFVKTIP